MKLGHEVRLMPPAYVKPYVKRGKTDAADAEAICEAVTRPTMRFVAVKTSEQQVVLILHKTRDLLVRQRTGLINALRTHLAEYGIISSKGPGGVTPLMTVLHEAPERLPLHARSALHVISAQLRALAGAIERLEAQILAWHRADDASRWRATIPGIGPITASAIAAAVPDATMFRSGRQFAAWLGVTPRPHSSGGKEKLGGISKQGDGYLRRLRVVGATAVMRIARKGLDRGSHKPRGAELFQRDDVIRDAIPRSSSGPAATRCCANRPNTWMHPTGAHAAAETSYIAGAVHTWLYGRIFAQLRRCRGRPPHHVTSVVL
jgi:transposase